MPLWLQITITIVAAVLVFYGTYVLLSGKDPDQ